MGIRIYIGNVGSGKTACAVRDMLMDGSGRKYYTNIVTRGMDCNVQIDSSMIIKKNLVEVKKKRDGTEQPIYDYNVNVDYWQSIKEPINVIIDEAHTVLNSRRAMSKQNIIMGDWLALLRRVVGADSRGMGDLILISQLPRRLDPIARDMATNIRFFRCHYVKTCKNCGMSIGETNDNPEPLWQCLRCGSYELLKHQHMIEVKHYANMTAYEGEMEWGMKTAHMHYFIRDIERVFPLYDTLQWDNLLSDIY
jgi:hypothetical protein